MKFVLVAPDGHLELKDSPESIEENRRLGLEAMKNNIVFQSIEEQWDINKTKKALEVINFHIDNNESFKLLS